jgi:hypothetical protein
MAEGVECNHQLRSRMFIMTRAASKASATFSAIVVALVALLASFLAFRWGFIQLWEWQHEGRRMVFVIDPEIKAAVLAILSSIAVFLAALRRSRHSRR